MSPQHCQAVASLQGQDVVSICAAHTLADLFLHALVFLVLILHPSKSTQ
jgi:hypothetical protein